MRHGTALNAIEDACLGHRQLVNGDVRSECPACFAQSHPDDRPLRVKRGAEGQAVFECANGCEPKAIERELERQGQESTPPDRRAPSGAGGGEDPAAALARLLRLPEGVAIAPGGCRIVGTGMSASADIALSNGVTMTFERIDQLTNARSLRTIAMIAAGVDPKVKGEQGMRALELLRELASLVESQTSDQESIEWGLDFLARAEVIDCDWSDQGERWAAASRLRRCRGEVEAARREGRDIAAASAVARHLDGTRYVRAGHVHEYVRSLNPQVGGATAVNHRMLRIGWTRQGSQGRIKATPPGAVNGSGPFSATYLIVPPDWEELHEAAEEPATPTAAEEPVG